LFGAIFCAAHTSDSIGESLRSSGRDGKLIKPDFALGGKLIRITHGVMQLRRNS
jgi:hypothetical protein